MYEYTKYNVPMKVLIVFNHPAPYKVKVFNELAKKCELDVIFERTKAKDRPDSFYSENIYNFNVKFITKGYFGRENSNTNQVVKYIAKNHNNYDLIIMNGYSCVSEMRAINFMHNHKIPFTLLINGGVIKKDNFIKKAVKKYFIKKAKYYLSPCEEATKYLVHYGADKSKIYHYTYSTFFKKDIISKPLSKEEKDRIREKYNLPNNKLIVSAGQFIKRKNNLELIKIFSKSKHNLVLIGDGVERELYKTYIKENNIDNVKILPFMKKQELFSLMKGCDGFITLSKEDIFGHTTLEAMACGIPVISSNKVVSSRQYIKNGYNGFCIDETNEYEVLKAINDIDSEMSENAIETANGNTIEKTTECYQNIFKELTK